MSLDVYLESVDAVAIMGSGIFIRTDGQTKEITRAEWDALRPGVEPVMVKTDGKSHEIYSANVTHNLGAMAKAADIYEHLWRPAEIGITKAEQLIAPLSEGLAKLKADPEKFRALEPENRWGTYADFVPWVERYLDACKANPNANVTVWR